MKLRHKPRYHSVEAGRAAAAIAKAREQRVRERVVPSDPEHPSLVFDIMDELVGRYDADMPERKWRHRLGLFAGRVAVRNVQKAEDEIPGVLLLREKLEALASLACYGDVTTGHGVDLGGEREVRTDALILSDGGLRVNSIHTPVLTDSADNRSPWHHGTALNRIMATNGDPASPAAAVLMDIHVAALQHGARAHGFSFPQPAIK